MLTMWRNVSAVRRALLAAGAGMVVLGAIAAAVMLHPFPPANYGYARADVVFRDCATCPDMLPLPAGAYRMGEEGGRRRAVLVALGLARSERRQITINYAFAVSRTEITFAQWDACVMEGGCNAYTPSDEGWGRDERPVINVSWDDAQAYVTWLSARTGQSYRLLSDAEWEYAARAGHDRAYAWGRYPSHERANFGGPECPPCTGLSQGSDVWVQTAPVAQFAANGFGLYDMHGNVYEWVQDCSVYDAPPPGDGSPVNTEGCATRVIRGGAWYSNAYRIRTAYTAFAEHGHRANVIGFRVARAL